jgi:putative methyltransferase (TIGR04325 family)
MSVISRLPFLKSIKKPFRSGKHTNRIFNTYQEALSECLGLGYDCNDLASSVVAKTKRYRDQLGQQEKEVKLDLTSSFSFASMLLAASNSTVLRVLDFGGAAGLHYLLTRVLLPKSIGIQWVVVETPNMVECARPALENQELSFVTTLTDACKQLGDVDIVHSSGAIQYVADPCKLVAQFTELNAKYLLLNRIGVTTKQQNLFVTHQSRLQDHGPGKIANGISDRLVRTPYVFASESSLISSISAKYRIVARIDDSSGVFSVPGEPLRGFGLLANAL